jgi:hypothetical protein
VVGRGPPVHGRLFDGGTDGSHPSSSAKIRANSITDVEAARLSGLSGNRMRVAPTRTYFQEAKSESRIRIEFLRWYSEFHHRAKCEGRDGPDSAPLSHLRNRGRSRRRRVREALSLVFRKFGEIGRVR